MEDVTIKRMKERETYLADLKTLARDCQIPSACYLGHDPIVSYIQPSGSLVIARTDELFSV